MKKAICHPEKPLYCKGFCRNCYEKQLKENNPEYWENQKKNSREWRYRNKEYCTLKGKEYRKNNPLSAERKLTKRLRKYNLTANDFHNLLAFQKYQCYICEQVLKSNDKFLHIDHCHKTGKVRGILCSQCNWFMSKVDGVKNCLNNLNKYVKNKGNLWEKQDDIIKEN